VGTPKPLSHALAYAERGFGVLPLHSPLDGACSCRRADCSSPAKHPRTINGLSDASTDPDTIRKWWAQWPAANVGVAVPPGYVVVDVDVEDASTATEGHELPATATAKTGRGWQFLYRTGRKVAPRVAVLEHVDLRGPGSYVVAPPSTHVNGTEYTWISPPRDGIADAPAWVYEVAPARSTAAGAPGADIASGGRNAELARLAAGMRSNGMTGDEIAVALAAVNGRCRPPLPDAEVRAIAASFGATSRVRG